MKKFKLVLSSLLMFILFMVPAKADTLDQMPLYAHEYNVVMKVHANGKIDFDISIDMEFNEEHQGIFLTVPQTYHMDMTIDGETSNKSYFFPVSNISSSSHEIDVDKKRDGVSIRMGTAGQYLSGRHTFNVEYSIQTKDLDAKGLQMFYMNMMPNGLDFPVGKLNYEVRFDKSVDGLTAFYYEPNVDSYSNTIEGNVIKGTYDKLLYRETVTVEVQLPNDYFTFPIVDFVKPAFFGGMVIAIVVIVIFLFFGKDPIVIETVEFTAPEGISSAEIGYIYRGMTNSKDVVSLIVYWASKGFVKIIEDENEAISLEKLIDLPIDWNKEEQRLFKKIFEKDDLVTMKSLENKLGETVAYVQMSIPKRFTKDPYMRVYDRSSSLMKALSIFLLPLIPAFMGYAVVLLKTSYGGDATVGFFVGYGVFFIITLVGSSKLAFDRIYKKNQRFTFGLVIVGLSVLIGYTLAVLFGAKDNNVMVISSLLIYSFAMFFVANTSRRTQQGANWVGQIRGLKRFIEVAEKDRLIALVEETPYLFYDILPYAYVLGVTDIWIEKFEGITMQQPDWYVSSNPNLTTYMMLNSLNRSFTTMSTSINNITVSSGSGGGSFGGGGGGGFSGGGFGGGGGGGW